MKIKLTLTALALVFSSSCKSLTADKVVLRLTPNWLPGIDVTYDVEDDIEDDFADYVLESTSIPWASEG
tara:strand:- start:881 stop:1087 length:207 start_codon:yes stop_codon:yes gene_type:complete